jgi:hypothetical protein
MIYLVTESLQVPYEGIFWYIDNKLVALCDQVNPNDPYDSTDLLHKDCWKYLSDKYTINGKSVTYDYFPRGRVETLVILDDNKKLSHYESYVYLDKCINKKKIIDEIIETFRLYLPNVNVSVEGQLFIDGSHYTCNNCKQ